MKYKKTKILIICFCIAIFVSCKTRIVYKDRVVEVPVVVIEPYERPPVIEEITELPIDKITHNDSVQQKAGAIEQTIQLLKNKMNQYKDALTPYYKEYREQQ